MAAQINAVHCTYPETGPDLRTLLEESFRLYLQQVRMSDSSRGQSL